ncbi:helix-turn-helix domain-containing protein [Amycolatopsis taiwanensis]|uniref:Helix-turn-helix domain-containing protein n=1 Tax=Amycolatopsis taiwanensis TaxID=342230 RepID=A0A9W6RCQ8_9PSEU|nr:helix-turn-helix domain-containing protein [Amycolatopsis taiwanensis]GLY71687.1 hypothetical protein Atai01_83060 [Amycolatopsis taiwanensis]
MNTNTEPGNPGHDFQPSDDAVFTAAKPPERRPPSHSRHIEAHSLTNLAMATPDATNSVPQNTTPARKDSAHVRDAATTAGPPLLYTPAEAAEKLATTESWLRRKAGLRLIPCTFVGKRLRFSDADLQAIVASGSRPAGGLPRTQHPRRRTRRR